LKTTLSNTNITIQIKHLGAELCSLSNAANHQFIWEGNPSFWGKHSPILFPIVGALKNNSYTYNQATYSLSRHGFARDMNFELIKKTNDSATFSLASTAETLAKYPFEFELQISYKLIENSVVIGYHVFNHGSLPMPFSIGAHPAFALPNNFEEYQLEFETNEVLESCVLEENLISDKKIPVVLNEKNLNLKYELFENDALIFKSIQSKSLVLKHLNNPVLKIKYQDFPDLGIWTMVNAPFICLEPWFGFSDGLDAGGTIFEKEGISVLDANQQFESSYSIEVF
jgi:galactose mutarotase-like enzyme